MHVAFLSTDIVEAKAFNRDTALIGGFEALGVKVTGIAPIPPPGIWFERLRSGLLRRVGYNVSTACDGTRLRRLAASIDNDLRGIKADIVFSRSTHFTTYLDISIPVINYVDAVFDCIVDFYPGHTHLDSFSLWAAHRAEKRALHRSNLTLLKSFWAAGRAIQCYKVPNTRVGIVQAPAILPSVPSRAEVLDSRSGTRTPLKCLIIGNDWNRKGADIALEAVRKVRGIGFDVRLTTLGMMGPPELTPESWLKIIPPLNKSKPREWAELYQIFLDADTLLLPARADFSPNVIGEAYAFGLPVIGSPVGAIPEMIEHGQTGFVTRRGDDADEYACFLSKLATEPGLLVHMAVECRNKYEAEFASIVVARKLVGHLESVIYQSEKEKEKISCQ